MTPISIEFPDWLAQSIIYGGFGLVFLCALAVLLLTTIHCCSQALKRRRVYGLAISLLTWKHNAAADWTYGMYIRAADLLRKDDSPLYYSLRHEFNRRTPSEPPAQKSEPGYDRADQIS